MGLENLNRWHWMLISLIVGALLGYAQLYDLTGKRITPDEWYSDRRTIGLAVLMGKLNAPKTEQGYAMIADLTIYPAIEGKVCVAGNELLPANGKQGIGIYRPFQQVTEIPFRLIDGPPPPSPTYSILDYVKDLQKNRPDVAYRFAWWAVPPFTWSIWIGGSFLVIGILFPTFLSVLMGAGYMPVPKPREKPLRKSLYNSGGNEEMEGLVKAKKGPISAAEQNQLDELTTRLEQNLGSATIASGQVGTATDTGATAAAIRKLEAQPLDEQRPLIEAPKEDLEWGGEFYPVAHAKHKEEEK